MASKILDQLLTDIKETMKSKDKEKLISLRSLHSEIKNIGINERREITDTDVATVVSKAIKQRQDSIDQFKKGNREDLAQIEQNQIDLYRKYQPKQLTEDEIESLVKNAISESEATSKKDMGKVMKLLMPQVKGKADGKIVSSIVNKLLA